MSEILVIILVTIGSLSTLVAAVGILRMPDFYMRLSVTVKASTVGVGLILIAAAIYFNSSDTTNRSLAIVLFLLLTAPVAGHLIGKAAYVVKTKQWEHNKMDELEGMYDEDHHLESDRNRRKSKLKEQEKEADSETSS